MSDRKAIVVGGGIVGLSTAAELAGRGWRVDVFDASALGRGASWAAAGMLAATREGVPRAGRHPGLYALARAGYEMWPDWADKLARDTGRNLDLRCDGAVTPAFDDAGLADLRRFAAAAAAAGARVELVDAEAARTLEPALAPDVAAAVHAPDEGHVDSRAVVDALAALCADLGVGLHPDTAVTAVVSGAPVRVEAGGEAHEADVAVLAAGWRTPDFGFGPPPVRPVKGQMFAVIDVPAGRPSRLVHAPMVYVAPRSNGRLLVGATEEDGKTDSAVDPVAISLLRAAAERALPGLALGRVESAWTGVRPATPDGAPILQRVAEGVVMAAGHHRNGVLLAPVSARIAADLAEGREPPFAGDFDARRFSTEGALTSG